MGLALARLPSVGIALATLAYYLLGAAWFNQRFGRARDSAQGHHREPDIRSPRGTTSCP